MFHFGLFVLIAAVVLFNLFEGIVSLPFSQKPRYTLQGDYFKENGLIQLKKKLLDLKLMRL